MQEGARRSGNSSGAGAGKEKVLTRTRSEVTSGETGAEGSSKLQGVAGKEQSGRRERASAGKEHSRSRAGAVAAPRQQQESRLASVRFLKWPFINPIPFGLLSSGT